MLVCRPGSSYRVGIRWKDTFLWWRVVRVRNVDHRHGRWVPEASVAEAEYEVPLGREGSDA